MSKKWVLGLIAQAIGYEILQEGQVIGYAVYVEIRKAPHSELIVEGLLYDCAAERQYTEVSAQIFAQEDVPHLTTTVGILSEIQVLISAQPEPENAGYPLMQGRVRGLLCSGNSHK